MKLKIICDSTPDGIPYRQHVKVIDAETGDMVRGVQSVDIKFGVNGPHTLTITTVDFDADLTAKLTGVTVIDNRQKSRFRRALKWLRRRLTGK